MLNANTKKIIRTLVTVVLVFIIGCSSPEERRAKSLAEAAQLQAAGDAITALELLEALSQQHPDDSEILQQIGLVQQDLGNHSEAAFYLSAAHNLSPNDQELLYQAYIAHEDADQPDAARDLLETFASNDSTAMTNALWFRLGELRAQTQKTETALEAYLEGVKLTNEKPSAEIALTIGTLFKQLDNLPMAGRWLTIAAKSDDPNALPALFGILEIHLRTKNWEAAEKSIALLDKKFPGAVDASEWASARTELEKWRAVQAEMKQQVEKLAQSQSSQPDKPQDKIVAKPTPPPPTETPLETSGKAQVVVDLANAEALATTPASETDAKEAPESVTAKVETVEQMNTVEPTKTAEPTEAETTEPTIVFNPDIIIQPAEPDIEIDDETTESNADSSDETAKTDSYPNNEVAEQQNQEILVDYEPIPQNSEPPAETVLTTDELFPDTTSLSLEEIVIKAKEAAAESNYEKAAQLYWDALGRTDKRADLWNALSKVYYTGGQSKNAAKTALQATRLAPKNIQYVLDYLRVAQRVKKPADFIKELEIAYDRFPRSPEITLSLARGYSRIGGNDYAAGILYRRFIQLAPKHPLRSEAEAALARIR